MIVLSLFDGMSCGQVALKNLNISVDKYYASEIDKYAIEICTNNFPKTIHLGSVTDIDTLEIDSIDLLIGGSPCQSFTFTGKRNGMTTIDKIEVTSLEQYLKMITYGYKFEGESYLFWEYIRILKETMPKYFLLENVKMETKWKNLITEVLGVEPILINSNLFSGQNRQRLYWTNIPLNNLPESNDTMIEDIMEDDVSGYHLTKKHLDGFLRSYKWKHCEVNEKSKPLLASYYKQPPHCPYIPSKYSDSGFRRLTPLECERLQTLPDNYTMGVSDTQRYKMIGNGWTIKVIEHILKNIKNK